VESTTWDGLPISSERPHGAAILTWRLATNGRERLILHRAHHGPEFEGEWAWTPPSGARLPGETIEECARRELLEETGLTLDISSTDFGTDQWAVFLAEAPADADVVLDPEHDRSLWTSADDAIARCLPDHVGASFDRAVRALDE
jgi:8-oxo-dGTP pyrophosphatase MutT (NUDIX family)